MARADLSSLLGKLPDDERPAAVETAPKPAPERTKPVLKPATRPTSERAQAPREEPEVERVEPAYLAFVRKDTRLREDQLEALTREARRLNRAKRNSGLRITENTLIRLGVDLLLERVWRASGDDEVALLRSLR